MPHPLTPSHFTPKDGFKVGVLVEAIFKTGEKVCFYFLKAGTDGICFSQYGSSDVYLISFDLIQSILIRSGPSRVWAEASKDSKWCKVWHDGSVDFYYELEQLYEKGSTEDYICLDRPWWAPEGDGV